MGQHRGKSAQETCPMEEELHFQRGQSDLDQKYPCESSSLLDVYGQNARYSG